MDKEDIGYCRPPKAHRFKKGQSGNPKGRPKVAGQLENILLTELERPIIIRQRGKPRKLDPRLAIVLAIASKAMNSDVKATKLLFQLLEKYCRLGASEDSDLNENRSYWSELTDEERRLLSRVDDDQPARNGEVEVDTTE